MTVVFFQTVHAEVDVTPVIDDQLGILSQAQKQKIYDNNQQLMAKRQHQQVWVITTDITPGKLSLISDGNATMDSIDIQDAGGLSMDALQEYGEGVYDYYLEKYTGANEHQGTYWSDKKYNDVSSRVNIIIIDPNFKYHAMPLLDPVTYMTIGEWRDFVLTHRFNFDDDSASGTMKNYDLVNNYINNKVTGKTLSDGPDTPEMVFWGLVIIAVIAIIIWIHKKRNYHGPMRTSFWDAPGDSNYDNGFIDGWYYGNNDGDDTFKH